MNCFGNKEEKYENPLEQEYENLFSQNNEDPFHVEESIFHGDIYGDTILIDDMSYREDNCNLFRYNELSSGQMDFEYVYDNHKETMDQIHQKILRKVRDQKQKRNQKRKKYLK